MDNYYFLCFDYRIFAENFWAKSQDTRKPGIISRSGPPCQSFKMSLLARGGGGPRQEWQCHSISHFFLTVCLTPSGFVQYHLNFFYFSCFWIIKFDTCWVSNNLDFTLIASCSSSRDLTILIFDLSSFILYSCRLMHSILSHIFVSKFILSQSQMKYMCSPFRKAEQYSVLFFISNPAYFFL